jgi:hypothetical protein
VENPAAGDFATRLSKIHMEMKDKLLDAVRFGALEEVFMSYRPHGAWRTMEVLEELA